MVITQLLCLPWARKLEITYLLAQGKCKRCVITNGLNILWAPSLFIYVFHRIHNVHMQGLGYRVHHMLHEIVLHCQRESEGGIDAT